MRGTIGVLYCDAFSVEHDCFSIKMPLYAVSLISQSLESSGIASISRALEASMLLVLSLSCIDLASAGCNKLRDPGGFPGE